MSDKILVVGADTSITALYVDLLIRAGLPAESTPSPERAVVLVDRVPVNLVIVDVDLPEKKGPKIAWAMREKGHAMPIVGLVLADSDWDLDDLKDLGFTELMEKPVDGATLVASARKLIGRRAREVAGDGAAGAPPAS